MRHAHEQRRIDAVVEAMEELRRVLDPPDATRFLRGLRPNLDVM